MDAEPMESDADLVLDLLDTVKQSETPVVKRCKKKSKKKSNSIIERREVAKSLLGLEKSNSIIERQEVAKRLLGLEKFRNVDTDIADFTVLFKPTLPKGVHEEGKHDVSLGRKEDSVTSTHSSVASTHSSAASTHSSAASTHSSVASTHSSAASIHSSVASTHSSAASTHSSAASTRSSIPQAASTLIQDNKPISQYVDNTNIGHPLDSTSTKGHEMKPSENVQLQRPTTKGVKVKRLLDSSLAWMSVRENEGYLMPGAIKDTKSEIQLSKKAKRRARREAIKTQKVALDIKSTEKTDISNERTGEHTETVILSKKARKRARRQAMNKPEGLSQVESTENIVTPRAPAMEFTHSAALPKKDRKEEAEHQTSSTSPMTDLKTMYSAQGAIPKSSMNKDLDIYSSILLGRGFWKLTPPGIKNRKISKTLPPARRGGPPARRGGPPARRGGPPARRGGPPARRGGPPARSTGPAVSNPLLEWGVHNTKNGSVPRGFSMQNFKSDMEELPDALASKVYLLPDLLMDSKASSTTKAYMQGFVRWKKWAESNGIGNQDILPAKDIHVALYLANLTQFAKSSSSVIQAFYSIKWAHSLVGMTSPTDNKFVQSVLEGAKRRLAKPVCKKEPVTVEMLQAMYDKMFIYGHIYNQRTITACLLAFSGFLRSCELLHIVRSDIKFFDTHMSVFIQKSKTDIYRDGAWVVIAKTNTVLCPVVNMELYLKWTNLYEKDSSDEYVFRNLSKTKSSYVLRRDHGPLSYTRMRELFIEAFQFCVPDISKYGLHSLRSGGASVSANMGVSDRLFKRHGRWRSETAKDGYVKDNLKERLTVSKKLGL